MKMNVKATGIELTPAILSYAEKRLMKVGKYLDGDPVMAVEIGKSSQHHKQGDVFRAEVRIAGSGNDFYAEKQATDLYAAIDQVQTEVIHEITKTKGRRRELLRRGQRAIKDMAKGFPWIGRRPDK